MKRWSKHITSGNGNRVYVNPCLKLSFKNKKAIRRCSWWVKFCFNISPPLNVIEPLVYKTNIKKDLWVIYEFISWPSAMNSFQEVSGECLADKKTPGGNVLNKCLPLNGAMPALPLSLCKLKFMPLKYFFPQSPTKLEWSHIHVCCQVSQNQRCNGSILCG